MKFTTWALRSLLIAGCLVAAAGCQKVKEQPVRNACELLAADEVQRVQDNQVTSTATSQQVVDNVRISRCLYDTLNFNRSVVLQVAQSRDAQAADAAWEALLRSGAQTAAAVNAMDKVPNLGEQSYLDTQDGATLLVKKGRSAIRLHVGGCGSRETCREKSTALAATVLKNL